MSPSTVSELFEKNPDQAYRITLASGDVVTLMRARHALVTSLDLYVGISERPDAEMPGRVKIISIPNITMIDPIDRPPAGRGRRTRR